MSYGPLVVLHDHLDGGLRPETVLELATTELPVADPFSLAAWFDQRESGSLERYLDSFRHTIAAMSTPEALRRVGREAVEDHAAAGVIHAELRFGPLLHRELPPELVVESVLEGLAEGRAVTGISTGLILCALRNLPGSTQVARLAVRYREEGVVGFDLAGPEAGFPPDQHLEAVETARSGGVHITLHAGEAGGVESIRRAVETCGAERIGHGIEIIDDCRVEDGAIVDLGPVAALVHDRRIPLEVAPSSNLATKGWALEQHPLGMLFRAGFNVTLNTDNRLMSATSMAAEAALAVEHLGLSRSDIGALGVNAARAAFLPDPEKARLLARL